MTKRNPTPTLTDSIPPEVREYLRNLPWKTDSGEKCGVLEGDINFITAVKLILFQNGIFCSWDETRPNILSVNIDLLDVFVPGWDLLREDRQRGGKQMFENGFAAVEHPDCTELAAAKDWLRKTTFKEITPNAPEVFFTDARERCELLMDMLLKVDCTKFTCDRSDGDWTVRIDRSALQTAIGTINATLSKHVSQATKPNTPPGQAL